MDHAAPDRLVALIAVSLAPLAVFAWILWMLASTWAKARQAKQQHELKVLMVQRGMSVEEMERVLSAGTGAKIQLPPQDETPPAKPQAGPINWPAHSNN